LVENKYSLAKESQLDDIFEIWFDCFVKMILQNVVPMALLRLSAFNCNQSIAAMRLWTLIF
jgi:hypothetical protein